jgi:8-amino-7-oxononanoate synthase
VTLSKSLGSQGGAVLGAPQVIETVVDTARSFVFDTGLAPASAGAAAAALGVLTAEPELAGRARDRARRLAATADALGLETTSPAAAVVPVIIGDPHDAVRAAEICSGYGVRVGCFRPPSVPHGRACLRLTARASLEEAELTTVTRALTGVIEQLGPYAARNAEATRR